MTQECHPTEKETTIKYHKISRLQQAEILQKIKAGSTIDMVGQQHNVPRTTIGHWLKRKNELGKRTDPEVVAFFESTAGIAFLHRLLTAMYLVFHKAGACGLPSIHKFLMISELSAFIGSSLGALHKVSCQIDQLLSEFGKEEKARLAVSMPHRKITGCGDETFFDDKMVIVLMEAVSGFILAEQAEERRDAGTWEKVSKSALEGLNVTLVQITGDEAGGLTSCATTLLGVHKSPDLFHVQQDITKGLTGHLGRRVKNAEDALRENLEAQKTGFEQFQKKLGNPKASLENPSVVKCGKKVLKARREENAHRRHLEKVKAEQEVAKKARKSISENYHPFDLNTGKKRASEGLKKELDDAYDKLEEIASQAQCTDNQKKKLAKSRGMMAAFVQTMTFFWCLVTDIISGLKLNEEEKTVFQEFLLPIEYLKIVEQRSGKQEKEMAKKTRCHLESGLRERDGPWQRADRSRETELRRLACECAQYFQRSSSCVEGHNGVLSLKHHACRRLSPKKLDGLVVLHNFFIERKDKTTAAERFFQQKPRDIFDWLLNRVSWPVRPRNTKYARAQEFDAEKVAA